MSRPHYALCRKILNYLNSLPESDFELSPPNSSTGKPDITGCLSGRYWAIEVKRGKDRLSKIQKYKHKKLKEAKAVVMVAWSLEDVKAALEYYRPSL